MNKNKEIMVTVLCLAYNQEKYIDETLKGLVTQQTDFKYEIIIHDDVSTDSTRNIIDKYVLEYPQKIKVIYQSENQYSKGVNIISTFMLPLAKGKYIAFCEGDDYWCSKDKLQKQVDFLEKHDDYSACVHQTIEFNCRNSKQRYISKYSKDGVVNFNDIVKGGNQVYQLSSLVFRREYMDKVPTFVYMMMPVLDYPLSIYLAVKGKIYFFNDTMSIYRLYSTEDSWTSNNSEDINKERWCENCRLIIEMLTLVKGYCNRYNKEIDKVIQKYNYDIDKYQYGKWIVFNKKYISLFKEMSIKQKVRCLTPNFVIDLYKRVKDMLQK